MTNKPTTVDEYVALTPKPARQRLNELRSLLRLADPDAHEMLKWGKPAFVNDGILYVYAALKNHVSLHPTPSVIEAVRDELTSYTCSGNTVQFPLEAPVPRDLVLKMARLRVREKNELGVGWK